MGLYAYVYRISRDQAPDPIDGISFVPILTGKRKLAKHKYLFFNYDDKNQYIVKGKKESRSDEEIIAEALTNVVVYTFKK